MVAEWHNDHCTKFNDKAFAKRYLQVLVDEIVVDGDTATMRGTYAALANAIV